MLWKQRLNNVQEVYTKHWKENQILIISSISTCYPFCQLNQKRSSGKNGLWSNHSGLCHFKYAPIACTVLLHRKPLLTFLKHAACDNRALASNRRLEEEAEVLNIYHLKQRNKNGTRSLCQRDFWVTSAQKESSVP